jgi:hypothetical protein
MADKVTADSFLEDVRDLALDRGVNLDEIKFIMPNGLRCDWNQWSGGFSASDEGEE